MKKCSYCGRENPDDAPYCSGCGQNEFKTEALPAIPASAEIKIENKPNAQKHLQLRVLIAFGVGIIISTISIYVAWQNTNHQTVNGWDEQWMTTHALKNMDKAIIAFQKKYNFAPTNFEQLQGMTNEVLEMDMWFPEGFVDGWHHPFIFSNEGTSYLIISYGRDGKSGGKGIDCDLTSVNPYPNESSPTFLQFWNNKRFDGMIDWSFICGVLAALLSLFTVRISNLTKRGLVIHIINLCIIFIGVLIVTIIITALHIPTGH